MWPVLSLCGITRRYDATSTAALHILVFNNQYHIFSKFGSTVSPCQEEWYGDCGYGSPASILIAMLSANYSSSKVAGLHQRITAANWDASKVANPRVSIAHTHVVHSALQHLPFYSFAIAFHRSIYSLNVNDRQTATITSDHISNISKFTFNSRLDEPAVHQESDDGIEVIQNLGEAYGLQIGIRAATCIRR